MSPLDRLRAKYPWPSERPKVEPSERGWDGGGRDLVTDALATSSARVVLEIGSFLGLSTRTWLRAAPRATVLCVDPWPDIDVLAWNIRDWPELVGHRFFDVFLSGCWPYRDRVIPVRGTSPEALHEIHALGIRPDLIYIDGDHSYEAVLRDLSECSRLFPDAVLTGDDWLWNKERFPPRSVEEAVTEYAAQCGLTVRSKGNTWVLDRQPVQSWAPWQWLRGLFRGARRAG